MAHEPRDDHKQASHIGSGLIYHPDFFATSTSSSTTTHPSSIPQLDSQMQGFDPARDLYHLQSGIEMLGFPWKNPPQPRDRPSSSLLWKGFDDSKPSTSSKPLLGPPSSSSAEFFQPKQDFSFGSEPASDNLVVSPDVWQENHRLLVDDSSLQCAVFPSDASRPGHGTLSLSLSSNKIPNVGVLQSFQVRDQANSHADLQFMNPSNSGDGFFGKSIDIFQQQQHQQQHNLATMGNSSQQFNLQQLKNSRYLIPTQELLNEFCSLEPKQKDEDGDNNKKNKLNRTNPWDDERVSSSNQSLYSLDFLELQKRKAKLVSILEEVNRRYRRYREQMRSVVSSFEVVAGAGAAGVYSRLASKAMSRHFRCLKDAIVRQIQATKKAMGEKDPVAPGTTRGETPRLKLLDQTLRQQRALQQMGMMESHPWRPQRGLPERSVSILRAWLFEHFLHPYPSDVDKHILARQTGLSRSQVSNWFINARVRLWKPMVEEMYMEETKEQDNKASDGFPGLQDNSRPNLQQPHQNPNPTDHDHELHTDDQKPSLEKLIHDPESLSSIINNSDKRHQRDGKHQAPPNQSQFARAENFGVVDLDFSTYSHGTSTAAYTNGECTHPNFGSGVSLTLGLQQHTGGGISLSFSPATQQSLFFSRPQMEECPAIQYSILDGEAQNLPYRDLMGAQLLHDLAG